MSEKENITAWVTKYALTTGVFKTEACVISAMGERPAIRYGVMGFAFGSDWHRTKEDARIDVERRRGAKIASLKKQIEKLETMKTVVPE